MFRSATYFLVLWVAIVFASTLALLSTPQGLMLDWGIVGKSVAVSMTPLVGLLLAKVLWKLPKFRIAGYGFVVLLLVIFQRPIILVIGYAYLYGAVPIASTLQWDGALPMTILSIFVGAVAFVCVVVFAEITSTLAQIVARSANMCRRHK